MATPLKKTFEPNRHLGLAIEKPAIPDFLRTVAKENGLQEKTDIHISVLLTKNAQILWRALQVNNNPAELMKRLETLFRSYAWEYTLTKDYFLQERFYTRAILKENGDMDSAEHMRRTIVQKVLLPDLEDFYAEVNVLATTAFTVPVPHIILFSIDGRGIGTNSAEEFKQFTKEHLMA